MFCPAAKAVGRATLVFTSRLDLGLKMLAPFLFGARDKEVR